MAIKPNRVKFRTPSSPEAARIQARAAATFARDNPDLLPDDGPNDERTPVTAGVNPLVTRIRDNYAISGRDLPADVEADLLRLQDLTTQRNEIARVPVAARRAARASGNTYFSLAQTEREQHQLERRLMESARGVETEQQRIARQSQRAVLLNQMATAERSSLALEFDRLTQASRLRQQQGKEDADTGLGRARQSAARVAEANEQALVDEQTANTGRAQEQLLGARLDNVGKQEENRGKIQLTRKRTAEANEAEVDARVTQLSAPFALTEAQADARLAELKADNLQLETDREALVFGHMENFAERGATFGDLVQLATTGSPEVSEAAANMLGVHSEVDKARKSRTDARAASAKLVNSELDAATTEAEALIATYDTFDAIPPEQQPTTELGVLAFQQAVERRGKAQTATAENRAAQTQAIFDELSTGGKIRTESLTQLMEFNGGVRTDAQLGQFIEQVKATGGQIPLQNPVTGEVINVDVPLPQLAAAAEASLANSREELRKGGELAAQSTAQDHIEVRLSERLQNFVLNTGTELGAEQQAVIAQVTADIYEPEKRAAALEEFDRMLVTAAIGPTKGAIHLANRGKAIDKQEPLNLTPSERFRLQAAENQLENDDSSLIAGLGKWGANKRVGAPSSDPLVDAALDALVGQDLTRPNILGGRTARDALEDTNASGDALGIEVYKSIYDIEDVNDAASTSAASAANQRVRAAVAPRLNRQQYSAMADNYERDLGPMEGLISKELTDELRRGFIAPLRERSYNEDFNKLMQVVAVVEQAAVRANPAIGRDVFSNWLEDGAALTQQGLTKTLQRLPRSGEEGAAALAAIAASYGIDASTLAYDAVPANIAKRHMELNVGAKIHDYLVNYSEYAEETQELLIRQVRTTQDRRDGRLGPTPVLPDGSLDLTKQQPLDITILEDFGVGATIDEILKSLEN